LSVVVAFHAMMSGYVTMAALHARLTGGNPLDREAIESQLELMGHMASELWRPAGARQARKRRAHA
jgi:hypothetical protein